ncbi:MAG: DUF3303 domain-containing protein [Methanomassiliicoccales archaeon]|nr:DUF3303 domain-containing protein [Methanomassiliicoccales archaeon]
MLFVNTWQLNRNLKPSVIGKVAAELIEKEKLPSKGYETLQWLVCPGGFGVSIIEAESEAIVFDVYSVWANAMPGLFESYNVMPAVEASEAISIAMKD